MSGASDSFNERDLTNLQPTLGDSHEDAADEISLETSHKLNTKALQEFSDADIKTMLLGLDPNQKMSRWKRLLHPITTAGWTKLAEYLKSERLKNSSKGLSLKEEEEAEFFKNMERFAQLKSQVPPSREVEGAWNKMLGALSPIQGAKLRARGLTSLKEERQIVQNEINQLIQEHSPDGMRLEQLSKYVETFNREQAFKEFEPRSDDKKFNRAKARLHFGKNGTKIIFEINRQNPNGPKWGSHVFLDFLKAKLQEEKKAVSITMPAEEKEKQSKETKAVRITMPAHLDWTKVAVPPSENGATISEQRLEQLALEAHSGEHERLADTEAQRAHGPSCGPGR